MPPTAILDVDGTLVDTNYHHAIAWYRAFRRHDVTPPVWRIHRHIGMGGDQLVAAVAGDRVERRQGDSIRATETALYADLIGEVQPFADARRLLELLRERGHKLVLAAMEKVGGGPAVLVGDSTFDCEAAGRADVPALAILTGGFSQQELLDAGAVTVFASIEELCGRLDETPLR